MKKEEFLNCSNKGDFISFCEKFNDEIKEIDTAIPMDVNVLESDERPYVTVYYKNGNIKLRNVLALSVEILMMG